MRHHSKVGPLEAEFSALLENDPAHTTDLGNAMRLVRNHGSDLRFVAPLPFMLEIDCGE